MAVKFIVAHSKDPNNVGDIASNPLQYFLASDEYRTIDIGELSRQSFDDRLPLILGGGGLFGNSFFGEDFVRELLMSADRLQIERMYSESWQPKNEYHKPVFDAYYPRYQQLMSELLEKIEKPTAPRFVWGAGQNSESEIKDTDKIKWPKALANYRLVGVRDYGQQFPWVPCASCMHPALTKNYEIKNDIIFFEHKKQLIKSMEFGKDPIPRFINSGSNVEQTIELLGSANIILTNSYHGAYWGILLGKRVMLVGGAWSSKFHFFKHTIPIIGKKDDWRVMIDQAKEYKTALEECRNTTQSWWRKIQECL